MAYQELSISQVNAATVDLGIIAEAGDWKMHIVIDGQLYVYRYTYGAGDPVIIDNVLQDHRSHSIKFVNAVGDLMNDTYYNVITDNLQLNNGQIGTLIVVEDTVTMGDGVSVAPSYQNDIMVGAKKIEVQGRYGVSYQIIRHTSFDPLTGTAYFTGDEGPGSIDGQPIIVKIYK